MSLTAAEQLIVEHINRARLDPLGEAARYGIGLNDGLSVEKLQETPMQPLAPNARLAEAATAHSEWMLESDIFSHTGAGGSDVGDRLDAAGYGLSGRWTYAENISVRGSWGGPDMAADAPLHHEGLFESPGHRKNILNPALSEIGIGYEPGRFDFGTTTYDSSMLTEKFAASGGRVFVTGVAYEDRDGNGMYSAGEGDAGVRIAAGGRATTTEAAGGYGLEVDGGGKVRVEVALDGGTGRLKLDVSAGNAKLDVIGGDALGLSADAKLQRGVDEAHLLGVGDLKLVGARGGQTLVGNEGDNVLKGRGGGDSLEGGGSDDKLIGNRGHDTLVGGQGDDRLVGGGGHDVLEGGGGDDLLRGKRGSDGFVFAGDWGEDTVLGFREGANGDVLVLEVGDGEATSLAAFLGASRTEGADLVYDMGNDGDNVIVLVNVDRDALTVENFALG